jgi:hypothetical protein
VEIGGQLSHLYTTTGLDKCWKCNIRYSDTQGNTEAFLVYLRDPSFSGIIIASSDIVISEH